MNIYKVSLQCTLGLESNHKFEFASILHYCFSLLISLKLFIVIPCILHFNPRILMRGGFSAGVSSRGIPSSLSFIVQYSRVSSIKRRTCSLFNLL
mmetsp:Transcript_19302/g.24401  ORF Transcript_19302/g.24401 Transcript_19302/m.24401 type:complete len:95 (+) Transcript_19302:558-842(+)